MSSLARGTPYRLYDTSELEAERIQLQEEMNIVAEMIQQCVNENAHIALDQTEYQKKYDGQTEYSLFKFSPILRIPVIICNDAFHCDGL